MDCTFYVIYSCCDAFAVWSSSDSFSLHCVFGTSTNSLAANLKIQQLNPAVVLRSIPCVQRSEDSVPISVHRVRGKQQRGDCWGSKAEESQDQVSAQFHGQKSGTWPLWVWMPGCENVIKFMLCHESFQYCLCFNCVLLCVNLPRVKAAATFFLLLFFAYFEGFCFLW